MFCSSHWYLAIICYPHLAGPVYSNDQPASLPPATSSEPAGGDNVVSSTTCEDVGDGASKAIDKGSYCYYLMNYSYVELGNCLSMIEF